MGASDLSILPRRDVIIPTTVFRAGAATDVPIVSEGAPSQTGNLQEWRNSGGAILSRIDPNGGFFIGSPISSANISVTASSANNRPIIIRGAASQVVNLQEWQNSAGTVVAAVEKDGQFNAQFAVFQSTAGGRPLTVRGAAGQTVNLAEFQNSSNGVLSRFDKDGYLHTGPASDLGAAFSVSSYADGKRSFAVRMAAGQTAPLAEFQNNAGATLTRITSGGHIELYNPTANNNANFNVTASPAIYFESNTWDSAAGNVGQAGRIFLGHGRVNVTDPTSALVFQATRDAVLREVLNITGDSHFNMSNATITPTTNTGGGTLYIASGELWYRGSNGTSTRLAVA